MPVSARVRTRLPSVLAMFAAAGTLLTGCGQQTDDATTIIRTTTNIAGAGVVGLERDTSQACPLPSRPDAGSRPVTHTGGVTQVPADPQRIVVLGTPALDAACALGLWERVVGTTTLTGPVPQPDYLGYGVKRIPSVGPDGAPDPARIAELDPDVIIGTQGQGDYAALAAVAPTVLAGTGSGWAAEFVGLAAGLARAGAAEAVLAEYRADAPAIGAEPAVAAAQSQASVVRFGADSITVLGTDSFAGGVLTDIGVRRPQNQRGASFTVPADELERVEGDVIFVLFDGEAGREYGESVLRSDAWKELGAASDQRVFAVEDAVWHGSGPTAARAVLTDVRQNLNGYVTG
ncbi:ABC transporter substrate-binding protein [Nocardia harenae]|uniref:ABC transporter substrate-binding protein n=1 Tax=Nocardia harenae TaxID=358707 RepID=UPI0008374BB9|nr:ABC transporter substrate-binding protein [Nocardia harenae]